LRRSLPAEVTVAVPADQLDAATSTAMATPAVQETVRAALLGVHGYVTGTLEAPPTLAAPAVDQAVRQQLVVLRPDLAPAFESMPPLAVTLPDQGLDVARSSRQALHDLVRWAAVLGCASLAVALVVSPRR